MRKVIPFILGLVFIGSSLTAQEKQSEPIRLAVVGMSHGHLPKKGRHFILGKN